MRTLPLLLVVGLASLAAQDRPALSAMADAERAFARAAAQRGIRAAFLEFLDDDAIGFQPVLGNAREAYRASPEPPDPLATKLVWEPRTGEIAASGDLGWLTGPYRVIPGGDGSRTRYGCYFSVWRRVADGPWRVLIDVGITTAEACAFAAAGFVPSADKEARFSGPAASARESLRAADVEVARDAQKVGAATALAKVLNARVRVHRSGHQPVVGRGAAAKWLRANATSLSFTPLDGDSAGSGDLGYTYGRYTHGAETGYYVRVWHRTAAGAWTLVADIESPAAR